MNNLIQGLKEKREPYCNRCGDCCKSFVMPFDHSDLEEKKETHKNHRSLRFSGKVPDELKGKSLLNFIEPAKRFENALDVNKEPFKARSRETVFFKCNLYSDDAGDGKGGCSIHKNRPEICRRYVPISDSTPDGYLTEDSAFYKGCSYLDFFQK